MRLTIRHTTTYAYTPEPSPVALRLKLYPARTPLQTPIDWAVTVNDVAVPPMLTDGFGDGEALWFSRKAVGSVTVVAAGTVETTDGAGVMGRIGQSRAAVFLRDTALTQPNDEIRALAAGIAGADTLARMHGLCERVHEALASKSGVTDAGTTAAQALALGAGVCQDKAHVMIAAARALGVPARYVVGYLRDEEMPLTETHAWVETHLEGLGWIGFDPMHKVCPTDAYVRLCTGLDAADAAPLRGQVQSGSHGDLTVAVEIAEAQAKTGQAQTQQ